MGDRSETGIGETGEVTGRQCEGVDTLVSWTPGCVRGCLCVCVSASAAEKQCSKHKNVPTAVVEGCKAGWLKAPSATTANSDNDAEA